jgi:hypothetical protein
MQKIYKHYLLPKYIKKEGKKDEYKISMLNQGFGRNQE